jgi:hypothetical protein
MYQTVGVSSATIRSIRWGLRWLGLLAASVSAAYGLDKLGFSSRPQIAVWTASGGLRNTSI